MEYRTSAKNVRFIACQAGFCISRALPFGSDAPPTDLQKKGQEERLNQLVVFFQIHHDVFILNQRRGHDLLIDAIGDAVLRVEPQRLGGVLLGRGRWQIGDLFVGLSGEVFLDAKDRNGSRWLMNDHFFLKNCVFKTPRCDCAQDLFPALGWRYLAISSKTRGKGTSTNSPTVCHCARSCGVAFTASASRTWV